MSPTKGAYYNEIDKGAAAWLREVAAIFITASREALREQID